jgi:hypothetical protein
MRQMDSRMPTVNDLDKQGRVTWTEQGKGWSGGPEEGRGARARGDGVEECPRERAARPSGRRPTEGAWDGGNAHTRTVASGTWTGRRAPAPPRVCIEVDGASITRPAPTPVER